MGEVAVGVCLCGFGDGDAAVEFVGDGAEDRFEGEVAGVDFFAVGVECSDGWPGGVDAGGGAEEWHQGFVDVNDVEAFRFEESSHLAGGFEAHGDAGDGSSGVEWDAASEGDDFEAGDVGSCLGSGARCKENYLVAASGEVL